MHRSSRFSLVKVAAVLAGSLALVHGGEARATSYVVANTGLTVDIDAVNLTFMPAGIAGQQLESSGNVSLGTPAPSSQIFPSYGGDIAQLLTTTGGGTFPENSFAPHGMADLSYARSDGNVTTPNLDSIHFDAIAEAFGQTSGFGIIQQTLTLPFRVMQGYVGDLTVNWAGSTTIDGTTTLAGESAQGATQFHFAVYTASNALVWQPVSPPVFVDSAAQTTPGTTGILSFPEAGAAGTGFTFGEYKLVISVYTSAYITGLPDPGNAPEPATLALLGVGAVAAGIRARSTRS